MKFIKWFAVVLLVLIIIYFLGPEPRSPKYDLALPAVPANAQELDQYINHREALHKLKAGNGAKIVWFDSSKQITDYAIVYLHGFSASHEEGNPVHLNFARKFGCNLFLSRLEDHGIDTTEAMLNLTADRLWNSAKEAYAIGKQLGKNVILMATSTGATLALKLAAEYPPIAGLILFSPNIAINDPNAWLLNNRWGLQIANLMQGKNVHAKDTTATYAKYWYPEYRMESAVQLEELLESSMKEATFQKIKQPVLVLYYYKDDNNQDEVVKVSAMKRMFGQLATPAGQKRYIAVPGAGDHVIGSSIKSKDVRKVEEESERFAKEILKLKMVAVN
jgi:pimeloyl-ACP methyl ester carboxylesterase